MFFANLPVVVVLVVVAVLLCGIRVIGRVVGVLTANMTLMATRIINPNIMELKDQASFGGSDVWKG